MQALGLSFVVPPAWTGQLSLDGEALLLVSGTEAGVVVVSGDTGLTVQGARAFLEQPVPLDAFAVARPQGPPVVPGRQLSQTYLAQTRQGPLFGH